MEMLTLRIRRQHRRPIRARRPLRLESLESRSLLTVFFEGVESLIPMNDLSEVSQDAGGLGSSFVTAKKNIDVLAIPAKESPFSDPFATTANDMSILGPLGDLTVRVTNSLSPTVGFTGDSAANSTRLSLGSHGQNVLVGGGEQRLDPIDGQVEFTPAIPDQPRFVSDGLGQLPTIAIPPVESFDVTPPLIVNLPSAVTTPPSNAPVSSPPSSSPGLDPGLDQTVITTIPRIDPDPSPTDPPATSSQPVPDPNGTDGPNDPNGSDTSMTLDEIVTFDIGRRAQPKGSAGSDRMLLADSMAFFSSNDLAHDVGENAMTAATAYVATVRPANDLTVVNRHRPFETASAGEVDWESVPISSSVTSVTNGLVPAQGNGLTNAVGRESHLPAAATFPTTRGEDVPGDTTDVRAAPLLDTTSTEAGNRLDEMSNPVSWTLTLVLGGFGALVLNRHLDPNSEEPETIRGRIR